MVQALSSNTHPLSAHPVPGDGYLAVEPHGSRQVLSSSSKRLPRLLHRVLREVLQDRRVVLVFGSGGLTATQTAYPKVPEGIVHRVRHLLHLPRSVAPLMEQP